MIAHRLSSFKKNRQVLTLNFGIAAPAILDQEYLQPDQDEPNETLHMGEEALCVGDCRRTVERFRPTACFL